MPRVLPWVLVVGAAGGAGYLYLAQFAPLAREHAALGVRQAEAEKELTDTRAELGAQTGEIDKLQTENTRLKAKVEAAARPLDDTQDDLGTLKGALEKSLEGHQERQGGDSRNAGAPWRSRQHGCAVQVRHHADDG